VLLFLCLCRGGTYRDARSVKKPPVIVIDDDDEEEEEEEEATPAPRRNARARYVPTPFLFRFDLTNDEQGARTRASGKRDV
jgi:hypothetical protein